MTRDKIDQLWQQAIVQSVHAGETFIRYHFTALVLEEAAKGCEEMHPEDGPHAYAFVVRAMKPEVK